MQKSFFTLSTKTEETLYCKVLVFKLLQIWTVATTMASFDDFILNVATRLLI